MACLRRNHRIRRVATIDVCNSSVATRRKAWAVAILALKRQATIGDRYAVKNRRPISGAWAGDTELTLPRIQDHLAHDSTSATDSGRIRSRM
jgi:hypothetical protein